MVRARVLLAATAAGLVLFAGCSKSEDQAANRQLFGSPPQIEQAVLNSVETQQVSTACDFTDMLVKRFCSEFTTVEPLGPIVFSGTYTLARFTVKVTDQEGVGDVLFVGASYSKPDSDTESTLVLFDDGSANRFPQGQALADGFGEDCGIDMDTGLCYCRSKVYEVTSSDPTAGDGTFTRAMAFFGSQTPAPLIDCVMKNQQNVGQFIEAGSNLSFRIDAVDKAGNLDTWDTNLEMQVQPSTATCTGDPCGCCLLLNTQGYDGACGQLPGMLVTADASGPFPEPIPFCSIFPAPE